MERKPLAGMAMLVVVWFAGTADAAGEIHYNGLVGCRTLGFVAGEPVLHSTLWTYYVSTSGADGQVGAEVWCSQNHLSGLPGYAAGSQAFVYDRTDTGQVRVDLCRTGGGETDTSQVCDTQVSGVAFNQTAPIVLTFPGSSDADRSFYIGPSRFPYGILLA
jgi:hypothetical protein